MTLARGARRSHPAKIAAATPGHLHPEIHARLAAHASGAQPLPDVVDLGDYWPSILDQNATGSCTAHAIACALTTSLAAAGKPLGFVPSPLCTYATTRALERAAAAQVGDLPALTDGGAEIADVIAVLAKYGVKPMRAPSPQGYNSDVDGSNVLAEPTVQALEQAARSLVAGPYHVDPAAAGASDTLAAALASGIAIDVAFFADTSFEQLGSGATAQAPNDGDPQGGGHSTALTGYKVVGGQRFFWLTNSWGSSWATGGRVLCSPAFVAALWEAWPVVANLEGGAS